MHTNRISKHSKEYTPVTHETNTQLREGNSVITLPDKHLDDELLGADVLLFYGRLVHTEPRYSSFAET